MGNHMLKIGLISCEAFKPELEQIMKDELNLLRKEFNLVEIEYLKFGLHVYPEDLKREILGVINRIKHKCDIIILLYGSCGGVLRNLQEYCEKPIIQSEKEDCIHILFSGYTIERSQNPGTFFLTPGWCSLGVEGLKKMLQIDKASDLAIDSDELLRMFFRNYSRVLYINTGYKDDAKYFNNALQISRTLNLDLAKAVGTTSEIRSLLKKAKKFKEESRINC